MPPTPNTKALWCSIKGSCQSGTAVCLEKNSATLCSATLMVDHVVSDTLESDVMLRYRSIEHAHYLH